MAETGWLRIDVDAATERVEMPACDPDRRLRERLGGAVDRRFYHRRAIHHIRDRAPDGDAQMNWAAWAAACVWMRVVLPHGIYGPVIMTGRRGDADGTGGVCGLDDDVELQLRACAAAVDGCRKRWQDLPAGTTQERAGEVLREAQRWMALGS